MASNKLTSSTGYFKRTKTGEVFLSTIWLGIYDDPDNYIEITKEEYDKARAEEELDSDDETKMLLQVETGITYDDAIDVYPCKYTYEEIDKPVEEEAEE